jgi:N-acetylmuramic acid 6-phosphate etherase
MTLSHLITELPNPASERIDGLSALEIVRLMNAEDATVAEAVGREAAAIARAIEIVAARLAAGGRLIYLGAGTSGRLGMLDAAECPPTFNSPPGQVLGIIAGGPAAMQRSVEGAEDSRETAVEDLRKVDLSINDVVFGIATSGRTPYVLGGLEYARQIGAATVALSCNREAAFNDMAEVTITPIVGPEVIAGSTRLKAGTATKMILNMVSTGAMVQLGKTYSNLMVDLRATNSKLVDRSRRIVAVLTGLSEVAAEELLARYKGEVKTAVVACRCHLDAEQARQRLRLAGGHLRRALEGGIDGTAHPGH